MIRCLALILSFLVSTQLLAQASKDLSQDLATSRDKLDTLERQENLALLRYNPMYFIYGNPDTKAQISFKFLLIRSIPMYAAYSQIIFWGLNEQSKPFKDATYNPEFFYRWTTGNDIFESVDIAPWSHHSNGKNHLESRSVDESFLRLNTKFKTPNWTLFVSLKGAVPYNEDDTNKDLYKYQSPFTAETKLINFFNLGDIIDKSELTMRISPGGKWGDSWKTGGYELGYNFRFGSANLFPTIYMQYYQGFAETLINYNEHVRQFRVGFSF